MLLSVTSREGDVCSIDVPADMEVENVKAYISAELPSLLNKTFDLLWNGHKLSDEKKTLQQYGVNEDDMLYAVTTLPPTSPPRRQQGATARAPPPAAAAASSNPSPGAPNFPLIDFSSIRVPQEVSRTGTAAGETASSSAAAPAAAAAAPESPESIRQLLLRSPDQLAALRYQNPMLAEAVQDAKKFAAIIEEQRKRVTDELRLRMADPFDVDAQRKIAETIQQSNIDASMEHAMEFMPESFGQVVMLYIYCEVNGQPVKAFVDSGAQMTIMSEACSRRCNIERLIDRRWAGVAKGVGTQKIVGRVHLGQIKIGSAFLPSSFTILVDQEMDLLLGLDMLRRHQCMIDLAQNRLVVGSSGVETPFLPESELPSYARLSNQPEFPQSPGGPGGPSGPPAASSSSSAAEDPQLEQKVRQITSHGFPREAALAELRAANGDLDRALATLLAKSLAP